MSDALLWPTAAQNAQDALRYYGVAQALLTAEQEATAMPCLADDATEWPMLAELAPAEQARLLEAATQAIAVMDAWHEEANRTAILTIRELMAERSLLLAAIAWAFDCYLCPMRPQPGIAGDWLLLVKPTEHGDLRWRIQAEHRAMFNTIPWRPAPQDPQDSDERLERLVSWISD